MKDYITKIREWIHSHIPLTKRKKKHFSTASVVALTTGGMLVVIMICFVQYRQYAGIPLHVLDDSSIAFSGYNGNGVVKDGFHPEQAMLDKLSLTIEQKDASGESTIYLSQLKDSIVCGFNKDSGLSNDEVITYSCTIDKELARNAGYQLVNSLTLVAAGLKSRMQFKHFHPQYRLSPPTFVHLFPDYWPIHKSPMILNYYMYDNQVRHLPQDPWHFDIK